MNSTKSFEYYLMSSKIYNNRQIEHRKIESILLMFNAFNNNNDQK